MHAFVELPQFTSKCEGWKFGWKPGSGMQPSNVMLSAALLSRDAYLGICIYVHMYISE